MKACTKCKEEFPATKEYFYNKRKSLTAECKKCFNQRSYKHRKTYLKKKPEMVWSEKDSLRQRNKRLIKNGFTSELFDEMLEAQGNVCALCGIDKPGGSHNRWHSDHDHKTGKARGLLCWTCNATLGHIEAKDPGWMDRAKKYINEGGFYKKDLTSQDR